MKQRLISDVVSASQASSRSFTTVNSSISQTQQLVLQIQGAMEEQQEAFVTQEMPLQKLQTMWRLQ